MRRQLVAGGAVAVLLTAGGAAVAAHSEGDRVGWQALRSSATTTTAESSVRSEDDDKLEDDEVRQLVMFGTFQRGEFVDIGAPDFSAGDVSVFEESLSRTPGGRVVGRDSVSCQVVVTTLRCSATFRIFGKGRIEAAGAFFSETDNVLAVTGGTGEFAGVGGTFRFFPTGDIDVTRFVFRLVPAEDD